MVFDVCSGDFCGVNGNMEGVGKKIMVGLHKLNWGKPQKSLEIF